MDWHRNNAIRKDRYLKTIYQQELSMLKVGDDGFYILQPNDNQVTTKPQPNDNPGQGMEENERKWEYREGNDREGIPVPQQIPDTGTGSQPRLGGIEDHLRLQHGRAAAAKGKLRLRAYALGDPQGAYGICPRHTGGKLLSVRQEQNCFHGISPQHSMI